MHHSEWQWNCIWSILLSWKNWYWATHCHCNFAYAPLTLCLVKLINSTRAVLCVFFPGSGTRVCVVLYLWKNSFHLLTFFSLRIVCVSRRRVHSRLQGANKSAYTCLIWNKGLCFNLRSHLQGSYEKLLVSSVGRKMLNKLKMTLKTSF